MTPIEQAAHRGERVILRRLADKDRVELQETAPVARLGRKYAYVVIYGRETAFDLETGYEKSEYSPYWRILTTGQAASETERTKIRKRLDAHGWSLGARAMSKISNAKLQRIADILEEDE